MYLNKVSLAHVVSNHSKKSKEPFKMRGMKERDGSRITCSMSEIPLV